MEGNSIGRKKDISYAKFHWFWVVLKLMPGILCIISYAVINPLYYQYYFLTFISPHFILLQQTDLQTLIQTPVLYFSN